jgi:hypothetical protein
MTKAEMDLLIREVNIQIDKIKAAKFEVLKTSYGKLLIGKQAWNGYDFYYGPNHERAELDRTMLSLQKNLVQLRRAMYGRDAK